MNAATLHNYRLRIIAEIDGARCNQHLQAGRRREHQRLRRKAEKTSASASAPGRPFTRTVAPSIETSWVTGAADVDEE